MSHIILTDKNFKEEVLNYKGLVLVDFWATWCGPCQMMGPVVDDLAKQYINKVKVAKMDIDVNSSTPSKYSIMSIPTIIFFKDGKPVEQLMGAQSKEVLKKKMEALLK